MQSRRVILSKFSDEPYLAENQDDGAIRRSEDIVILDWLI